MKNVLVKNHPRRVYRGQTLVVHVSSSVSAPSPESANPYYSRSTSTSPPPTAPSSTTISSTSTSPTPSLTDGMSSHPRIDPCNPWTLTSWSSS